MPDREEKSHKKRKRKEKDKEKRKEKSKKKHKTKDKKEVKEKSSKRRKERALPSDSSSSSSGSESEPEREKTRTADEILILGRQAVHLLRVLLAQYPKLRTDFRQLLKQLDEGEGVDVSGLGDPQLKRLVTMFFDALMLQCSRGSAIYRLPATSPKVLATMVMVFAEDPDPTLAGPLDKVLPQFAAAVEVEREKSEEEEPSVARPPSGEDSDTAPAKENEDSEEGLGKQEERTTASETTGITTDPADAPPMDPIGPQMKRTLGPSMPPPDVLAAAAAVSAAQEDSEDEFDNSPMIGPPPPALVEEDSVTTTVQRDKECERILNAHNVDAYGVLGIEPENDEGVKITQGFIKKSYFRASLRVHPDKCAHPRAKEAFDLLNKAHKLLQDPVERAALDNKRDQAQIKRVAMQMAVEERQAALWRRSRGNPKPGDDALIAGEEEDDGIEKRGTWMTELPPQFVAVDPLKQMSQTNVTQFAKVAKKAWGDTSGWTDNPEQARARQAQMLLQGYSDTLRLEAVQERQETAATAAAAVTATTVDKYNERQRPQTLMEQHQAVKEKAKKKAKKEGKVDKEDWEGNHPWKPWDRDKDLEIKPKAKTAKDLTKLGGTLGNRFGGGATGRSFL